jgi:hypothetical protein
VTAGTAQPEGWTEQPAHTLVPVGDDGEFLLLGDPLPDVPVLSVPFLRLEDEARISTALATATASGVAVAGMQAASALQPVQGLVRLAPETLKALRGGATPMTDGVTNLGSLVKDGKVVAHVRWLPAGAVGAGTVLAAVGPVLAVLAVQRLLTTLSQQVQRSLALTQTVLDELRAQSWHELHAAAAAVAGDARAALAIGEVPDRAFANLQGQGVETQLRKHRAHHLDDLQRRQAEFERLRGDKARAAWLTDNLAGLLRDVQAVHAAQQALSLYQALRAANLRRSADAAEDAWARHVVAAARAEQEECLALLDGTVRALDRALSLLLEVDPTRQVPVPGGKQPLKLVRDALRQWHLSAALPASIGSVALDDPAAPLPSREVGLTAKDSSRYRRLLRWVVEPGEPVELVADGELDWTGRTSVLLVLTADRLLFADRSALDRGQAVVEELPLHAVRLTLRDRVGNREQIGLAVGEREGTFLVRSDPAAPVSSELLAAQRRLRGDTPLAHGQAGGG